MIKGRDILLYFSVKYEGDWDQIYCAIKRKENVNEEELQTMKAELDCEFLTMLDADYPESLRNSHKPPFVLFYHGDISLINSMNKILAVVGSRDCSEYSRVSTIKIINELKGNFHIVSGMALGIDGIAHRTCLSNGTKTIAVLASGINYPYPKTNKDLYERIKKEGLILSEYPGKMEPRKDTFPIRNRIIVSLGWGVFIPEVHEKSGTMISIGHACQENKDVMVLPQQIDTNTFNDQLIKDGACLVRNGLDILDEKI